MHWLRGSMAGERSYNGVAIASRRPCGNIAWALDDRPMRKSA